MWWWEGRKSLNSLKLFSHSSHRYFGQRCDTMYAFGDIKCVTISKIVATCPSLGQFHPVCVYGDSQQSRHKTKPWQYSQWLAQEKVEEHHYVRVIMQRLSQTKLPSAADLFGSTGTNGWWISYASWFLDRGRDEAACWPWRGYPAEIGFPAPQF